MTVDHYSLGGLTSTGTCYLSTMAMAVAVVNEELSLMEHMTAAKAALATASAHAATLTGTFEFPDKFIAG